MKQEDEQAEDTPIPLDSLFDWMKFLSGRDRFYFHDGVTVHVHGDGDASGAVFEKDVSASPLAVDQYVVHPRDEKNRLFCLVKFLGESDFNLERVMKRIGEADYSREYTAIFKDVNIVHRRLVEREK